MINLGGITNENNIECNEKWPYISDDPYRILISEQNDIDKVYLYARDLSEPKYEYLIKNVKIQE